MGAPGTGKSQAIMGLLDRIRERGDAAVIYDSKGTFTGHYYDAARGDILLNPLDKRSPVWTPWAEIEDEMDADRLAQSLIPAGDHSTPFFHDTARAMLSAAMSKMLPRRGFEPSLEQLLQLLLHGSPEQREAFYRNTDVTQIFDQGGERMRVSVEQNLRTYLRSLRHLPLAEKGDGDSSRSCATSRASTAATGSPGCSCPRPCGSSTPRSSLCSPAGWTALPPQSCPWASAASAAAG